MLPQTSSHQHKISTIHGTLELVQSIHAEEKKDKIAKFFAVSGKACDDEGDLQSAARCAVAQCCNFHTVKSLAETSALVLDTVTKRVHDARG